MEVFEAAILSVVFLLDAAFFALEALFFPSSFQKWRRGKLRAPPGLPLLAMLAGVFAAGLALYLRSVYRIAFWWAPAALLAAPMIVYLLWIWIAGPEVGKS